MIMSMLALVIILGLPVPPLGPTMEGIVRPPVVEHVNKTELPASGEATYYHDSVFSMVVRNQIKYGNIEPGTCEDCDGYAAMLWPGDLNRIVCVYTKGVMYRLWVVDSASGRDRPGLIDRGWVIDIQRSIWKEMGFWDAPVKNVVVKECNT